MTPANDNRQAGPGARWRLGGNAVFAFASAIVVGMALLAGLAVSDPPWVVRDQRLDGIVSGNLGQIERAIAEFHALNQKLPAKLSDLRSSAQVNTWGVSEQNLLDVEYSITGEPGRDYSLCAVFLRQSEAGNSYYGTTWKHGAGRQCFKLKVAEK